MTAPHTMYLRQHKQYYGSTPTWLPVKNPRAGDVRAITCTENVAVLVTKLRLHSEGQIDPYLRETLTETIQLLTGEEDAETVMA